ncbi:MAG: hypothetical protein Kow0058_18840 [Roseovarius sp.]
MGRHEGVKGAGGGHRAVQFEIGEGAIAINIRDFGQLQAAIRQRLAARAGFALATLNLDHLVKLRADPAFAAA